MLTQSAHYHQTDLLGGKYTCDQLFYYLNFCQYVERIPSPPRVNVVVFVPPLRRPNVSAGPPPPPSLVVVAGMPFPPPPTPLAVVVIVVVLHRCRPLRLPSPPPPLILVVIVVVVFIVPVVVIVVVHRRSQRRMTGREGKGVPLGAPWEPGVRGRHGGRWDGGAAQHDDRIIGLDNGG